MPRRRKPPNPFEGVSPEVEREIRKAYAEYRTETLEEVVSVALKYEAEKGRADNAHRARLGGLRNRLEDKIRYAWEARQPITEVTELDIAFAKESLEKKRILEEKEKVEAEKGPSYENVASLVPKDD